jgi:AraC-like DNA-binding protein
MVKTAFTLFPVFVCLFWMLMFLVDAGRNKFVRFIMFAFFGVAFLLYFAHALYFNYEYSLYLYFDVVYNFATIAVYPLYFVYIVYLTREVSFNSTYFFLLIPAVFMAVLTAVLYLVMGEQESISFIRSVLYFEEVDYALSLAGKLQLLRYHLLPVVFSVQLIAIVFIGSRNIIKFDEKVKESYADTEGRNLTWTQRWFLIFALFSVFSMIANALGRAFFLSDKLLYVSSFVFSILLFLVGYASYRQRFTAIELHKDQNEGTVDEELFKELEPSYIISESQRKLLKSRLQQLLEDERIYTKKDLRIVDVSARLNTNRTYVSRVINQEYGKSFSDLINYYRFKEARQMLISKEYALLSVSEIAQRAGFPSESSFYRIFKKETGVSPGDWRKINYDKRG